MIPFESLHPHEALFMQNVFSQGYRIVGDLITYQKPTRIGTRRLGILKRYEWSAKNWKRSLNIPQPPLSVLGTRL